jgi:hypothetical protein
MRTYIAQEKTSEFILRPLLRFKNHEEALKAVSGYEDMLENTEVVKKLIYFEWVSLLESHSHF